MTEQIQSLAHGDSLTPETFNDFINRLRYHCKGEGVSDHCTADAIFLVEQRVYVYGIDRDYTDQLAIIDHEGDGDAFRSLDAFWDDRDDEQKEELNRLAQEHAGMDFMELRCSDRYDILEDAGMSVTGWDERWDYVCAHFTKEAAEAFIRRKGHDYRAGLRVYVNAQVYCWEWNAIKSALIDGRLVLAEEKAASGIDRQLLEAMKEVLRISDRSHEAWDQAKALIAAAEKEVTQ